MFKNIFIVTGPINSGKTTRLMEWCKNRNDVYGILTPKINGKRVFMDVATGDQFEMEAQENEENVSTPAPGTVFQGYDRNRGSHGN